MAWIRQNNDYARVINDPELRSQVPSHPHLSAETGSRICQAPFPSVTLYGITPGSYLDGMEVGDGESERWGTQLLPGLYEYKSYTGDNRVPYYPSGGYSLCRIWFDREGTNPSSIEIPYGKPFTFRFFQYHGYVELYCPGAMHRIGD